MRILLLAACAVLTDAPAIARAPASQAVGSAIAVTIDVGVVDGSGRAIPGLGPSDFIVELDGQPRRVVAATYFPSGPPMAGAIGPAFDTVTAAPPAYRVVVQLQDDTAPGREFTIAVSVSRPGAKVLAPPRAAAAPVPVAVTRSPLSAAPKSPDERLRTAISTGRVERALPIRIGRAVRRAGDSSKLTLEVQIDIDAAAKTPLTTLLGLVDPRGAIRSATPRFETAGDGTHHVQLALPLDPGPHKLRVAVVDAAGAMGAVESAVNAQLTPMGPLLASDLLRWTADANGRRPFLLDDIPSSVATLGATLELYSPGGASPPGDLLVKIEMAGIERIVTPEARDGVLAADAEFPVERLAPGTYAMRATVSSATAVLGSLTANVVKR